MIIKYTDFINEKLILEFNASIFGLSDVPELFTRSGFEEKSAEIMAGIIRKAFRIDGDQGVIDALRDTLGVEVFNVSRGKYSFEPYSVIESIKEDKEKARAKEEKRYLSKSEIERMTEPQRRAAVNKRKELGSMNDDDLQKESLRDKMSGKVVDTNIDKYIDKNIEKAINEISTNLYEWDYFNSYEEAENYVKGKLNDLMELFYDHNTYNEVVKQALKDMEEDLTYI